MATMRVLVEVHARTDKEACSIIRDLLTAGDELHDSEYWYTRVKSLKNVLRGLAAQGVREPTMDEYAERLDRLLDEMDKVVRRMRRESLESKKK